MKLDDARHDRAEERARWGRKIASHLATLLATALLGAFLSATMVRLAPGFGLDERTLDPRLDKSSLQALREAHAGERNIVGFYVRYMAGVFTGTFGFSQSLGRPISELLVQRSGVTLNLMAAGIIGGWLLGLTLAVPAALWRMPVYDVFSTLLSDLFLCIPSAALAILLFVYGGPVKAILALVLFPKIFQYVRNLLRRTCSLPHVLMAKAKGLRLPRIFLWHVLPQAGPELLALLGVTVSIAFSAVIPIEVICDLPGIGQLAWKAALARDLPVLVTLTLLITLLTQLANSASDLAIAACTRRQS